MLAPHIHASSTVRKRKKTVVISVKTNFFVASFGATREMPCVIESRILNAVRMVKAEITILMSIDETGSCSRSCESLTTIYYYQLRGKAGTQK